MSTALARSRPGTPKEAKVTLELTLAEAQALQSVAGDGIVDTPADRYPGGARAKQAANRAFDKLGAAIASTEWALQPKDKISVYKASLWGLFNDEKERTGSWPSKFALPEPGDDDEREAARLFVEEVQEAAGIEFVVGNRIYPPR
jgi:hypothetical protein